ncbi:hypothetical protein QE382_004341 [Sphingobacterium zeae]|uniref:Uncharacterized protein n=1 Tax=Sphingobacterium zeae TaxID=1776859 RepID=A0ABU0UBW5_9SPHI|nr:hypothetical protein [Sphingobacterium zeae]
MLILSYTEDILLKKKMEPYLSQLGIPAKDGTTKMCITMLINL